MAEDRSMLDVLRGSRILAYAMGVLFAGLGLAFIFIPEDIVPTVAKVAGALLVVVGVAEAFEAVTSHRKGSYWGLLLVRGIINIGFGALLVFWPGATVVVLVWVFGIDLVVTGLVGLVASRSVPKEMGRSSLVIRSVFAIVFGLVLMIWPDRSTKVLAVLFGIQMLLLGLILLFSGWQLSKAEKEMA